MTDSGSKVARDRTDTIGERAIEWLLLAPEECDDTEVQDRFSAWLAADPEHARQYVALRETWADPALGAALQHVAHPEVAVLAARRQGVTRWPRIAALAVAAAVATAVALPMANDLWLGWRSDFRTLTGERHAVVLPDGSQVDMNTDTALALGFDGPLRRVELLRGEARFEVESDPSRPFVVTAGHAEVTATGTAFTVRRDADSDIVVLLEGVVSVAGSGTGEAASLSPGEAVRVDSRATLFDTDAREPDWLNGRMNFDGVPLAVVAAEVDRHLGGRTLVLSGGQREVSGTLLLDQLALGLGTLATATGLELRQIPGNLRIVW